MQFELNGQQVEVADDGASLLEVLRDRLGITSTKPGCNPQGQCGCCTVLVDGEPRVSCVTPARRIRGRSVTTLEGLDTERQKAWGEALCATGGSQCGYCTPGIVMRLEGGLQNGADLCERAVVDRALAAHLCRCTGWQTIVEAAAMVASETPVDLSGRDFDAASRRASIEGHAHQRVAADIALGMGGFADDTAPADAPVALLGSDGSWVVAPTMVEARKAGNIVQGRNTTVDTAAPIDLPEGDWAITLQTGWVDPAYLETDAAWAEPGSVLTDPVANGGAFGAKVDSPVPAQALELAEAHGTAVRLRWSREDVVRRGPKRPPMAIGLRADGTGIARVARTAGIAERIASFAPGVTVEEVDVVGPPTSASIRGAGWAEVAAVQAALRAQQQQQQRNEASVTSPEGASATVRIDQAGAHVSVRCGEVLDETVVRAYAIGAVHMALGWVRSERLAVGEDGVPLNLTIRSFGIVRPHDMIPVTVEISDDPGAEPVSGSDAVFAAAAAAAWLAEADAEGNLPGAWPTTV